MFGKIADFFLEGVAGLLAFFYELPVVGGSYGFAIVLMTLFIMLILMPLTLKSTRSTIKMTQMQPKLKALQKKYKDDKQKLNAEVIAFYKKEKISPLGGCLPMLLQMPVFLILFNVIRGITRRIDDMPFFGVASQFWKSSESNLDKDTLFPKYLDSSTSLYQDLKGTTSMDFGPIDLGNKPWDIVTSNFFEGLPYVLLIVFVVLSSFYQQRQIQARRGSKAVEINPQQKIIMRFLPLLSGVWGFVFPAGLVLYQAISNSFRIAQQAYITRSIYNKSDMSDSDEEEDELEEESEVVSKETKSLSSNKNDKSSREAAWAKRRNAKVKSQAKNTKSKNTKSSRTTPKGTKPSGSKKNRKR